MAVDVGKFPFLNLVSISSSLSRIPAHTFIGLRANA